MGLEKDLRRGARNIDRERRRAARKAARKLREADRRRRAAADAAVKAARKAAYDATVASPSIGPALSVADGQGPQSGMVPVGKAVASLSEAAGKTFELGAEVVKSTVGVVAGEPGEALAEAATTPLRVGAETGVSAGIAAGQVLQGAPVAQLASAPLAALLRDTQAQYIPRSKPLPDSIKVALRPYFEDPTVVDRARWAVGEVELNFATIVNMFGGRLGEDSGSSFQTVSNGTGHAMTAGHVIVFNRKPLGTTDDVAWWAHELYHVTQYDKWDFEEFARQWLTNYSDRIEKPAKELEERVQRDVDDRTLTIPPVANV